LGHGTHNNHADPAAQHHDLPELARFMLATGLRLGEALGVTWADLDLAAGTVAVRRTIIRVQGKGLIASRVKSKASERGPDHAVLVCRDAPGAARTSRRLRGAGLP
jgi:integrase